MSDSDHDPIKYQFGLCCSGCQKIVRTKQAMHRHHDLECQDSYWWCGCCAKKKSYGRLMHHLNKKRAHKRQPAVDDATFAFLATGALAPPAQLPVQAAPLAPPQAPLLATPRVCAVDAATSPAMFSTATPAAAAPQASARPTDSATSSPSNFDLGLNDTDLEILLAKYSQSSSSAQPPAPAAAPAAAAPPPAAAGTPTTFYLDDPTQHLYFLWLVHMEYLGLLQNQPVRRQQLYALTGAFRAAVVLHHYDAFDADLTDLISRFGDIYEHWPGQQ